MKSPQHVAATLTRLWDNGARRATLLLGPPAEWPLVVPIARPTARQLREQLDDVKRHIEAWRGVTAGVVRWQSVTSRATSEPVQLPSKWELPRPSDWVAATQDVRVRQEFRYLSELLEHVDAQFHAILVRRRSLWRERPLEVVRQAAQWALTVEPGMAAGAPLRAMSLVGNDTKFCERHGGLLTALLDERFDGQASQMGLEVFLNAAPSSEHWLLVCDLDGGLMPYEQLRVRSSELSRRRLPGSRLLVVENERCKHLLPTLQDTVAVLGGGFDLDWLRAHWVTEMQVAYWGDLDTWGLQFLASARSAVPGLTPLLMDAPTFNQFRDAAVPEPVIAGHDHPVGLTPAEEELYDQLLAAANGRLEQEFLPPAIVHQAVLAWAEQTRAF